MFGNSEFLPFQPREFLAAQKAIENAAAAFKASQVFSAWPCGGVDLQLAANCARCGGSLR